MAHSLSPVNHRNTSKMYSKMLQLANLHAFGLKKKKKKALFQMESGNYLTDELGSLFSLQNIRAISNRCVMQFGLSFLFIIDLLKIKKR